MIIELFGAPGSGKTFLTNQFIERAHKNRKFISREDFVSWIKDQDRLYKLRCIFRNLFFSISYSLLLVFLRVTVQKPNVEKLWIPRAVLNEVLLREFMRLNSGSVILLDQGSIQRIVCYILFTSQYHPTYTRFILNLIFPLLDKCKIHIFVNTDISISTDRVINRSKDPSVSRFDSIHCKDSLYEQISEVTQLFSSLALAIDSKKSKSYTFDNTKENKLNTNAFDKLISTILK